MEAIEHGLALKGVALRPGPRERGITVDIPAPGQRGILQALMTGRQNLTNIKPLLETVNETSGRIRKKKAKRLAVHQKLTGHTQTLKNYCNKILSHVYESVVAGGDDEQDDGDATGAKGLRKKKKLKKARAAAVHMTPDDMAGVLRTVLRQVDKIEADMILEEELIEDVKPEVLMRETNALAGELHKQVDAIGTLTRSVMNTQFNRDARTAVGRGPPGRIAFSPFTTNDPLFEREDVVQVIYENNRRNGKV